MCSSEIKCNLDLLILAFVKLEEEGFLQICVLAWQETKEIKIT